jgi:hypothetical protein
MVVVPGAYVLTPAFLPALATGPKNLIFDQYKRWPPGPKISISPSESSTSTTNQFISLVDGRGGANLSGRAMLPRWCLTSKRCCRPSSAARRSRAANSATGNRFARAHEKMGAGLHPI